MYMEIFIVVFDFVYYIRIAGIGRIGLRETFENKTYWESL